LDKPGDCKAATWKCTKLLNSVTFIPLLCYHTPRLQIVANDYRDVNRNMWRRLKWATHLAK